MFLQHLNIFYSSDSGSAAVRLVWRTAALLLLPEGGLHPPLCHVRLPRGRSHPLSPSLALPVLPSDGSHQRLLWFRAHDSGRGESSA